MNLGKELVSVVLKRQCVREAIDSGFTAEWLEDSAGGSEAIFDGEDYTAYKFILAHYAKHRKTPDVDLFLSNYPTYKLSKRDLTSEEVFEIAIEHVRDNLINRYLSDAVELQDKEKFDEVASLFEYAAHKLTKDFTTDRNTAISMGDPDFDIEAYLDEEKTPGAPMGIESIDEDFWGWQPGQLITLVGRQKAGKTTLLLNSALAAWEEGYSVLVFSVELSQDEIRQKILSLGAHVSPTRLRRRTLHDSERKRVVDFDHRMKDDEEDVFFMISNKAQLMSVADIKEEIEMYKPHVVYIDGTYFIWDNETKGTPDRDWRADANVSAELKLLSVKYDIPVVVTTQSQEKQQGNSKKPGLEARTIQGGTGLLKFSDLVLGIDMPNDTGVQMVNGMLSRFSPVDPVLIKWDYNDMSLEEIEPETMELEDDDL